MLLSILLSDLIGKNKLNDLQGIIGLGMGKANGIGDAIKKANRQVCSGHICTC